MALEAVVFSQDINPIPPYNSCRDQYSIDSANVCDPVLFKIFDDDTFGSIAGDFSNYSNSFNDHNINNDNGNYQLWDIIKTDSKSDYSSPEGHCNNFNLAAGTETERAPRGGGRRKRRRRSCKNEEEVEQQRMTHITVERNRRKQMNDYLALIRSFMPPSYAPRGDQASIVGGAINYVKELEQLLQTLEAHKRSKDNHNQDHPQNQQPEEETEGDNMRINDYFPAGTLPTEQQGSGCNSVMSNSVGGDDEEQVHVTMVETHANVKILARKKPKQLLKLVAGFQGLRLSVLHLNITSLNSSFIIYSFSLKVEDGCEVSTVEDITSAANHILGKTEEETAAV